MVLTRNGLCHTTTTKNQQIEIVSKDKRTYAPLTKLRNCCVLLSHNRKNIPNTQIKKNYLVFFSRHCKEHIYINSTHAHTCTSNSALWCVVNCGLSFRFSPLLLSSIVCLRVCALCMDACVCVSLITHNEVLFLWHLLVWLNRWAEHTAEQEKTARKFIEIHMPLRYIHILYIQCLCERLIWMHVWMCWCCFFPLYMSAYQQYQQFGTNEEEEVE